MTIDSRKVFRIYRSLDKSQLQFVFDKKIENTLSLEDWLKKLKKIAEMDLIGDESRKKSGNLAIVFVLLSALAVLLSIYKPVLFFFPAGFFILFIYFLATFILLRKIDIGNNMRMFIVPVLEDFNRNHTVDKPFYLRMDFSSPIRKDYLARRVDEDHLKPVQVYEHHWMKGKLEFIDGVKISWEIKDVVIKKGLESMDSSSAVESEGKFQINHILNMHFLAPKTGFIAKNEMMETDDGKYYIVSIHKKDISENLEKGMSYEVFLSSIQEGYNFVDAGNVVNS